jgi:glycosyltransferase involved in cell wall biosynthesis
MRIAIIPQPGHIHADSSGYNKRMYYLARGLAERGHAVRLFAADPRSNVPGVDVVCIPMDERSMEARLYFISECISRSQDCDVINAQTDHLATPFDRFSAVPIVHTLITSSLPPNAQFLLRKHDGLRYSGVSHAVAKAFPFLPFQAVIHNGCDTGRFAFNAVPEEYFLTLSRIDSQKGVGRAVAAARAAGVKLVIAGKVLDNVYFHEQIEPHLGDDIEYLGELQPSQYQRKVELIQKAKAVFSLSEYDEGFSNTVLEALSCGTPVIASDQPSYREIIQDGVNGFVADDEESAAAACARIGEVSRERCRATVETEYTYDHMVEGYETLFTSVVSNK